MEKANRMPMNNFAVYGFFYNLSLFTGRVGRVCSILVDSCLLQVFYFMRIQKTKPEELDTLMDIFAGAKTFMERMGNGNQWIAGYPSRELIAQNIADGHSYVGVDDAGDIVATFFFRIAPDETYANIYDGQWLNDEPYGVVHRLASSGKVKGVSDDCLQWCFDQCGNIRVDTHKDNKVMQNAFIRNGFTYCGIIYIKNGAQRLAFQKYEEKRPALSSPE